MPRIKIQTKQQIQNSEVIIQNNYFDKIPKLLEKLDNVSKFCIITDHNVQKLYAKKLLTEMKKLKLNTIIISICPGENSKTRIMKARIENQLIEHGFNRDSCIIALGGGVVGDLAGFVAATYYRGIQFIQIPTTLLSMVDASIGGKNGISVNKKKNLIGSFYQASKTIIDPQVLKTLPKREFISGLVESIKTALVLDKKLFELISDNFEEILRLEKSIILELIEKTIKNKIKIVEKDEKESGLRQILNYGHSIGHALETLSEYEITHGEAVLIGMYYSAKLAKELKILKKKDLDIQNKLLQKLNLNLEIPKSIKPKEIIQIMKNDKKNKANKIRIVLLKAIGKYYKKNNDFSHIINEKILNKILKS